MPTTDENIVTSIRTATVFTRRIPVNPAVLSNEHVENAVRDHISRGSVLASETYSVEVMPFSRRTTAALGEAAGDVLWTPIYNLVARPGDGPGEVSQDPGCAGLEETLGVVEGKWRQSLMPPSHIATTASETHFVPMSDAPNAAHEPGLRVDVFRVTARVASDPVREWQEEEFLSSVATLGPHVTIRSGPMPPTESDVPVGFSTDLVARAAMDVVSLGPLDTYVETMGHTESIELLTKLCSHPEWCKLATRRINAHCGAHVNENFCRLALQRDSVHHWVVEVWYVPVIPVHVQRPNGSGRIFAVNAATGEVFGGALLSQNRVGMISAAALAVGGLCLAPVTAPAVAVIGSASATAYAVGRWLVK